MPGEIIVKERAAVRSCVEAAKTQFSFDRIVSICSSRQLFSVSNELLGTSPSAPLPSDVPRSELPQRFCDFCSNKICNLHDDMDFRSCGPPTFAVHDCPMLSYFDPVTEKEISELIVRSPSESCTLVPTPTVLMKLCVNNLVPLVSAIVNVSLSTGTVDKQFKQAVVVSLLKKPGVDT